MEVMLLLVSTWQTSYYRKQSWNELLYWIIDARQVHGEFDGDLLDDYADGTVEEEKI